jgi:hypothetical protein
VINYINAFGSNAVPNDGSASGPYYDVNADGFVAPNDALAIINALNAGQGGEAEPGQTSFPVDFATSEPGLQSITTEVAFDDLITLLAVDANAQSACQRGKHGCPISTST